MVQSPTCISKIKLPMWPSGLFFYHELPSLNPNRGIIIIIVIKLTSRALLNIKNQKFWINSFKEFQVVLILICHLDGSSIPQGMYSKPKSNKNATCVPWNQF